MKNIIYLFIIMVAIACQPKEKSPIVTIVSGTITNMNGDTLIIKRGLFSQKIAIDSMGKFSAALENIEEGNYTLSYKRESTSFYITPGEGMALTVDNKQFDESLTYTGYNAALNNYKAQKVLFDEANPINYKDLLSIEEADYIVALEVREKNYIDHLSKFTELSEAQIAHEKKAIYFNKLSMVGTYKSGYRYFKKQPDFEPSAEFMNQLNGVDFTNEKDFLDYRDYKDLVKSHFTDGELEDDIANLSSIKSELIKNEIIKTLQYAMGPTTENLTSVYQGLFSNSTDEKMKKKLTDMYEVYQDLVAGKPSPSFNYEDRNGKKVSLEELKGKNVYIDVWATWCGPCKAEIPSLKSLEAAYHDKNIEFVSISIDKQKDKDKWLTMISEKELKGVQLMADNDWKSSFVIDYGIQGIPRFILVDKEGKIVSADAPRPSSDSEIKEIINGLNI